MTAIPSPAERFHALLQRAEAAESTYQAPPMMKDFARKQGTPPSIFIVACADPRADPTQIFKLRQNDAVSIKNAGGLVTDDVLRSLEVIGTLVPIGMVVVLHHSDCGGLFTSNEQVRQIYAERYPEHAHLIDGKVWGAFPDLDESVKKNTQKVQDWKFLPKDVPVEGWVFEGETGKLRQVV